MVEVGSPHYVTQVTGSKRRKVLTRDNFYYVSILSTLEQILQMECVRKEISQTLGDGMHLHDFCDGEKFKKHDFSVSIQMVFRLLLIMTKLRPVTLWALLLVNSNLGAFFTLGNIRPSFRSSLKSIFLVAVAKSTTIKAHRIDVLLKPFVDDLNMLHDTGITIHFSGRDEVWKGALLAFLADNLAAHELGGFKESFSFAHRICR